VFCFSRAVAEAQTVTLTITNNGVVSGAVGVQGPGGNVCNPNFGGGGGSGTCVFSYPVNTPLRIAANSPQLDAGFLHDGTGDAAACSLSTCNIVLTTDSAITATFDRSQGPVATIVTTLLGDGKGDVLFDNGTCQNFELGYTDCTTHYAAGSEVKLQGQSMPGNLFVNFSNGTFDATTCSSTPCVFTVSHDSTISATFVAMTSVEITPNAATVSVSQSQNFSARAKFTNNMTRFGFGGITPWQNHVPMDVARFSLAAVGLNDRVYALGGVDGACAPGPGCLFAPRATMHVFNPLVTAYAEFEQAWTVRASMGTAREGLAAVAVNGKIYAIGGHTDGGGAAVSSIEAYDPATDSWTPRASMSGPRAGMAAAAIGNTIYVVGGDPATGGDPSIPLATVEAYDTLTNTWTTKAPMLTTRSAPAAAAIDGILYVIGGDGSGSVEAYDPATNTWTAKAVMPGGGGNHKAAALNGLIYVVGGPSGIMKVYNSALDQWLTLGSMPSPVRGQFGLAVLDGRLFAAGGQLADQTAVTTFTANRPPESTWWSGNTAVARINSGNSGTFNTFTTGTATISARLVAIDSGAQSATLTVTSGGGGGGSTIFLGIPSDSAGGAFANVGNPNWGCGTFSQNATGSWTVQVNYGEPGGGLELTTFQPNPAPGTGCTSASATNVKGMFFFNHAYASAGDYPVTVIVTNTATAQSTTGSFHVHVQDNGGGGGGGDDDGCAPVTSHFTVIGTVPFTTVHLTVFDRVTGEQVFEGDAPLGTTDLGGIPLGQFRIELTVPAGYQISPSSINVDPICGEPITLNATVQAIPTVPPTIVSLTPSETSLWPVNHKYHAITIAAVATNATGADISGQCSIVSASSSEPNTDNDFAITGPLSINLRAERLGTGDGRSYTITVRCTDADGLSSTKTTVVTVPKNQSKK
jgi:hypothetical protein